MFEAFKLSKDQAWWLDFNSAFAEVDRSIVTTPGVPADRVAYLRKVFDEILNDKKFVAEMNKKRRPIGYASGDVVAKNVKTVLGSLTGEKKKQVAHVILEQYY